MPSRPDACKPFALAKKRAPETRSLFLPHSLHQGSCFLRAALRDLAPGWGNLGHEAFQRLEDLLG
jgi:hypothetical protein